MSAPTDYDVAIVGAGPAGSAAAIELARAGRRVGVFERKSFPRQKVCGGCLSGTAVHNLRNLLPDGQPLAGIPGRRISFIMGSCRITCDAAGHTRLVLRSDLDHTLASAAAAAGAEVHFASPAVLLPESDGWALQVQGRRIRAGCILLAGGLLTRPVLPGISGSRGRGMLGLHWCQPLPDGGPALGEVELHWLRGGYVGLAVPASDCCVVGVACRRAGSHSSNALEWLRRMNPGAPLWSLLPENGHRRGAIMGCAGFPWLPDRLGIGNVLLIGDLAGYAEPFSGEGIGQALISAHCAAQAILQGPQALTRYTKLIRKHHASTVRRTHLLGRLANSAVAGWLASYPALWSSRLLGRVLRRVHVRGAS